MTPRWCVALLGLCLVVGSACHNDGNDLARLKQSPAAVARETRLEKALGDHNAALAGKPLARWILPAPLREISGLAFTKDGRMLAEGDEIGEIWEVDYRRGILVKHFFIGEAVKGDFEAITVANDAVFLMASNGRISTFHEGANNAHVAYNVIETGLKKECEFEGMVFDPTINSLVLACKHIHDRDVHDAIVLYRWSLASDTTARLSKLTVPLVDVFKENSWKHFHPSDIAIDGVTGNYVLIASLEKTLIEITPAGSVVLARPLPDGHPQAEGIAITKDSILIVSDEATSGPAIITLYKWP
ncbi:MAG TPA: SdiA-regulated domain-containing protein [Gemmatimonadaceae bacterium]|nr:SdiA-regulated domain-containing protein [Gemmatimonadaceae bacterium]